MKGLGKKVKYRKLVVVF